VSAQEATCKPFSAIKQEGSDITFEPRCENFCMSGGLRMLCSGGNLHDAVTSTLTRPLVARAQCQLDPVVHADLTKYLAQIIPYRLLREVQLVRDYAVAAAFSDILADLGFTFRESSLHVSKIYKSVAEICAGATLF